MMNKYKLYEVDYIKGMLMYKYIDNKMCNNIIEAEDEFEMHNMMKTGVEYVITIERQ